MVNGFVRAFWFLNNHFSVLAGRNKCQLMLLDVNRCEVTVKSGGKVTVEVTIGEKASERGGDLLSF